MTTYIGGFFDTLSGNRANGSLFFIRVFRVYLKTGNSMIDSTGKSGYDTGILLYENGVLQ